MKNKAAVLGLVGLLAVSAAVFAMRDHDDDDGDEPAALSTVTIDGGAKATVNGREGSFAKAGGDQRGKGEAERHERGGDRDEMGGQRDRD